MKLEGALRFAIFIILMTLPCKNLAQYALNYDYDYFYSDPGYDENNNSLEKNMLTKNIYESVLSPRGVTTTECVPIGKDTAAPAQQKLPSQPETTQTVTLPQGSAPLPAQSDVKTDAKAKELNSLIQHLYIAEARVQLQATEIKRAQAIATAAQERLEEAANHVRVITGALQSAQQEVATAAINAQTAQLQLAAHDQLLFAARQNVDALSSQMVGLQAEAGIAQPKTSLNIPELLAKLKKPLNEQEKPTAIPPVIAPPVGKSDGTRFKQSELWQTY